MPVRTKEGSEELSEGRAEAASCHAARLPAWHNRTDLCSQTTPSAGHPRLQARGSPAAWSGSQPRTSGSSPLVGTKLNIWARRNSILLPVSCIQPSAIRPLHGPWGSPPGAQRNKWLLLEVVESFPQNSFLSINAHLIKF